ncbi:efflux RND transporter periplasmic adaptor subunit [Paraburkholderia sp. ZP32-5]|uniref:efflux RND transporter periplasmic adaptor subunit n=1 Tax=Paraburkholderia sp. ZP32-5 TaxID=2883245 RepID=UPI001F280C4D|nr:efflux RND transporter periplasmic adaptor subunit [Paraburkholderia sp. ZP32-5]
MTGNREEAGISEAVAGDGVLFRQSVVRTRTGTWVVMILLVLIVGGGWWFWSSRGRDAQASTPHAGLPPVTVSVPLQRNLSARLGFLGQFAGVDDVEIRAQVGGTLKEIHFKDGDIVHKGDLLFVIDPEPYEIRLAQANAQLESATARLELANREFTRAQTLRQSDAGSQENVDQRAADQRAAQASVDAAKAQIRDAKFDLDHCRVTAPLTGRIGAHLVSIGNLIAGSRAGTSPTTPLAKIVSLDPVYLDFDMSEADHATFERERAAQKGPLASSVEIALGDDTDFSRHGTLDFIDNALDRSSGTIRARATVPNRDFRLTPGEFARVRLTLSEPVPTLLVPDASVLPDQSNHVVMTVGPDGTVVPKPVQIGELRGGLRVVRSGLKADDRVIIDGLPYAMPGTKVKPTDGEIGFASASASTSASSSQGE